MSFELLPQSPESARFDATGAMSRVTSRVVLDEFLAESGASTLAGKRVLVIGVGNAGLEAVQYAASLGAEIVAVSTSERFERAISEAGAKLELVPNERTATPEQKEHVLAIQREAIATLLSKPPGFDVVICAARRISQPAPRLISQATILALAQKTIFYDLTASSGGNCEGNEYGKTVVSGQSEIRSRTGYPKARPAEASKEYAGALTNLFGELLVPNLALPGSALDSATSMGATAPGMVHPKLAQSTLAIGALNESEVAQFFRSVRGQIDAAMLRLKS